MNYEQIFEMLANGTRKTAEANLDIKSAVAYLNAEIEVKETIIMALQDLLNETQQQKVELENERDAYVEQLNHKRTISDSISDIFSAAKKAMNPTVETIGNNSAIDASQQMSSTLNKLRYDHRKGAISDAEFKEGLNILKQQIDELED